jgi:predicted 2-oxoglutarate/Fe(II)-dependent dioxygenase YbiX
MQKILFSREECSTILSSISQNVGSSSLDLIDRKYKEWLIVDSDILNLITNKLSIFNVRNIKEGRILKYDIGCFFNKHVDMWEKYPHRYKTVIIQLSDSNEYEGGIMKFGTETLNKNIGNVAIFSSDIEHGMEMIKSGTRYAFVVWLERDDFGIQKGLL